MGRGRDGHVLSTSAYTSMILKPTGRRHRPSVDLARLSSRLGTRPVATSGLPETGSSAPAVPSSGGPRTTCVGDDLHRGIGAGESADLDILRPIIAGIGLGEGDRRSTKSTYDAIAGADEATEEICGTRTQTPGHSSSVPDVWDRERGVTGASASDGIRPISVTIETGTAQTVSRVYPCALRALHDAVPRGTSARSRRPSA